MFNTALRDQILRVQVKQVRENNPSLSKPQAEAVVKAGLKSRAVQK